MVAEKKYQHSEMFGKLKRIDEQITDNLTSVEYLKSLDILLDNALHPIIASSRYVDTFLAKILAWQSTNPKRKTTSIGKASLPSYITTFLITASPSDKIKIYQKIGFDRGITTQIIRSWMTVMEQYEVLCQSSDVSAGKIRDQHLVLTRAGATEESYAYGAYLQTKFWFNEAVKFKAAILEKYTRLCLVSAQRDYVKLKHRVDLNDIVQIYLMTASKAIDKCDANKGVLTTHIQNWLLSAKNIVIKSYLNKIPNTEVEEPEDKVAKSAVPSNHQDIIDHLLPATDEVPQEKFELAEENSVEDSSIKTDKIDRVRQLARFFDPKGYARLVMGIREYVTPVMAKQLTMSKPDLTVL